MSLKKMTSNKLSLQLFDGYIFPLNSFYKYDKFKEAINYKPTNGDIFVASYPKSGTTWTQYIVWEILNDAKEPPFVNEMWFTLGAHIELIGSKKILEIGSQPRFIKSHLSFSYIPFSEEGKYIYIARNPWEVCFSYYRNIKEEPDVFGFKNGSFDDFFNCFINGITPFGDYFDHIMSWFSQRNRHNILFLTYEQLKSSHREYIIKIAEFMGKEYSEKLIKNNEMLDKIVNYTDFEYMKTIPFLKPVSSKIVKKKVLDVGKNFDVLKTNDYKLQKFFNVGKVGYAFDMYNEKQINQMNSTIEKRFKNIPELTGIWRKCGVKI